MGFSFEVHVKAICYRGYHYSLALPIYIAFLLHSYSINSVLHLLSPTIRDTISLSTCAFVEAQ
jgi:hypothetical protein